MTTEKGKILIIRHMENLLALLIRDNQVLSAQVFEESAHAVGNIYVGRVDHISENIGAAFVNLGKGCLAFLPLSEASHAHLLNRKPDGRIRAGDELLVQIARAPMKTKLPGVTGKLSLAGQYAVVAEKTGKKGAGVQVSAKLGEAEKKRFRETASLKSIAEKYRLIVRTNAGELTRDEPLIAEAQGLADALSHILEIADKRTCYSCLFQGKPGYVSFVENAYRAEYDEVITDLPKVYEALQEICRDNGIPLRLYEDSLLPLAKLYSVEMRIKELLDKKVWLKSGGYLVIEPTEALIAIDVNTGKYEAGKNQEETFRKINREAAEMIALHMRARNLSGMILVDFINLKDKAAERALLEQMRGLLKRDPVPARVHDMTGLGLMELTRKKVAPSLAEQLKTGRERMETE